jgi:DNA (cytosine-5)-methyltransferase 1
MTEPLTVLSLFSGCGGLDLGFVRAGFRLVASIDHWRPACDTHRLNSGLLGGEVLQRSLRLADGEIALEEFPKTDVVLGGPPCQGFSFAGKQRLDDARNQLYLDFLRIVQHTEPRCFVLENVRGIEAMALTDIRASFGQLGYDVAAERALATSFGVAQRRERILVVGFRKDLKATFSPPEEIIGGLFGSTGEVSILDAIKGLPKPAVSDDETAEPHSDHIFRPLTAPVQRFVRHIPNGGCFRDAPTDTLPPRLLNILQNPARYRTPRLFPKPNPFGPAQTVPADMNPSLGGVLAQGCLVLNGGAAVGG